MPTPPLDHRDVLAGLAPAAAGTCARCGKATAALANGRGRVDICDGCGVVEFRTPAGLDLFQLNDRGRKAVRRTP